MALIAGCGARSSVLSSDPQPSTAGGGGAAVTSSSSSSGAGAGGAGTSSSSGASTSSSSSGAGAGGGGPVSQCVPLGEIELPTPSGYHARRPALAALGPTMAAAVALDAVGVSEPAQVPIADVVFDAWGAWPPAIVGPYVISADGGRSFVIAPRPGGRLALLALASPTQAAQVAMDVDPMGVATLAAFGWKTQKAYTAEFLATNGAQVALGVSAPVPDTPPPQQQGFRFMVLPQTQPGGWTISGLTCSSSLLVGDGIPLGDEFLIAAATSVPVTNCAMSYGGPSRDVRFFLHHPPVENSEFTAVDDILQQGSPERIRLAPRSDGAWAVVQVRGLDGVLGGARAYRISKQAHPLDEGVDVLPEGPTNFALAARGDGFTLVWIEPGGAALGLALFDQKGAQASHLVYPLAAGATVSAPPAIQISPDGSMLLVTWSQAIAGAEDRVHAVRFGCAG